MLPSLMALRRWPVAAVLLVVLGCQAPAPDVPTAVPVVPAPTAAAVPSATAAAATTASRIETLNAANAAFKGGDLKAAAGLYDRVVNTPPGSVETAPATMAIDDFAWFRGMITLLADGREDEARTDLDTLKQRDPTAALTRLGDQLYNQYGMVGQLRGACAQLQPQVQTQAGPALATLQGLGVNNVDAASLCSVPPN